MCNHMAAYKVEADLSWTWYFSVNSGFSCPGPWSSGSYKWVPDIKQFLHCWSVIVILFDVTVPWLFPFGARSIKLVYFNSYFTRSHSCETLDFERNTGFLSRNGCFIVWNFWSCGTCYIVWVLYCDINVHVTAWEQIRKGRLWFNTDAFMHQVDKWSFVLVSFYINLTET